MKHTTNLKMLLRKRLVLTALLLLLITSSQAFCLNSIVFVMESESSNLASRVYNFFTEFYRGSVTWVLEKDATSALLSNYNTVITVEESAINSQTTLSLLLNTKGGSCKSWALSSGFNSRVQQTYTNKKVALDTALDLLKEFDPEYYKILIEGIKDHFEILDED